MARKEATKAPVQAEKPPVKPPTRPTSVPKAKVQPVEPKPVKKEGGLLGKATSEQNRRNREAADVANRKKR